MLVPVGEFKRFASPFLRDHKELFCSYTYVLEHLHVNLNNDRF